jgi:putative membrane protein
MMGSADIVPGVSGGTIAFILGIYEQLINSIKTVSGTTLQLILKLKIKQAWQSIPFRFLIPLFAGIFSAIFLLSNALSFLLAHHPSLLWAFFFGLVLASVFIVRKRIPHWTIQNYLILIAFAALAYFIVGMLPVETPSTLLAFFASGAIAICAMILPGISGSFLLVIMGKYEQILQAVTQRDIVTLGVFMVGAAVGLAIFSRILSWLFLHYHDFMIASLTGFMVGSLRKIWPWKETITTRINSHGELVPLIERNIIPEASLYTLSAILLVFAGFLVIMTIDKLHATSDK